MSRNPITPYTLDGSTWSLFCVLPSVRGVYRLVHSGELTPEQFLRACPPGHILRSDRRVVDPTGCWTTRVDYASLREAEVALALALTE